MHFYENMPSTSSYVRYTSHQNTAQSIKAARLYTTHSIQSLSGAKYLLWVAINPIGVNCFMLLTVFLLYFKTIWNISQ